MKINLADNDVDLLFRCAFRYALGRSTYIVSDMTKAIAQSNKIFIHFLTFILSIIDIIN